MSNSYKIPAASLEVETEVKKSRFIARATKVITKEEAKAFIEQARQDYPDARHHCWAYLIGNPATASSAAMNDDGEPSGTAGKPILNVIQHKGIGDVMVVVIRYFGGIKLGAGGLTRAYSGAAEAVLSQLKTEQLQPQAEATLILDFANEQSVRHWLDSHQGEVVDVDYSDRVTMIVNVIESNIAELEEFCAAQGLEFMKQELK